MRYMTVTLAALLLACPCCRCSCPAEEPLYHSVFTPRPAATLADDVHALLVELEALQERIRKRQPNFGVASRRIGPPRDTINGRSVDRNELLRVLRENSSETEVPADAGKLRLTVIGSQADCRRVEHDLAASPALAAYRDQVVFHEYRPEEWPVQLGHVKAARRSSTASRPAARSWRRYRLSGPGGPGRGSRERDSPGRSELRSVEGPGPDAEADAGARAAAGADQRPDRDSRRLRGAPVRGRPRPAFKETHLTATIFSALVTYVVPVAVTAIYHLWSARSAAQPASTPAPAAPPAGAGAAVLSILDQVEQALLGQQSPAAPQTITLPPITIPLPAPATPASPQARPLLQWLGGLLTMWAGQAQTAVANTPANTPGPRPGRHEPRPAAPAAPAPEPVPATPAAPPATPAAS